MEVDRYLEQMDHFMVSEIDTLRVERSLENLK